MWWLLFVGLVLTSSSCALVVPQPLLLYPRGRGYKEGNRVGYNMIPIKIVSMLAYFTYIFIDIIIYALGRTSWSFGIFWVADPSLGLSSPCGVVPWVPILIKYTPSN
jgi:hypothetical protein